MKRLIIIVFGACLTAVVLAQTQNMPPVSEIKQKAEAGDAMAQGQYAQMLQFGHGVEKNEAEALTWYQKSAEAGNHYAQANMGVFCQTGGCGMEKDLAKAAEWYQKAAKQGNAYAQFYLSYLYEDGKGVDKDIKKAIELLEQAAKGGLAKAQIAYALRLQEGNGVDMNLDEALKWAERAAAGGEENAVELVPLWKKSKAIWDKTPKSLLGVEFGSDITKWSKSGYPVKTTHDGMSLKVWTTAPKRFRKFEGNFDIFASLDTKKIYKFCWNSESFADGTSSQAVDDEASDSCKVIAKKFGVECRKNGYAFEVQIGWVKVSIKKFLDHHLEMTVVHEQYEALAKKEYEAKKAAQGDGSDAL